MILKVAIKIYKFMPAAKKSAKPKIAKIKAPKPIGVVTHYYGNIEVAIIKFNKAVKKGIKVRFSGATTNFEQVIDSMQYDHKNMAVAPKGKEIGVKVDDKVRDGDQVFLSE